MERFDGPEGHKAFQNQVDAELHHLHFSPTRKGLIIAATRRRRVSLLERVRAILDYEITLTLPQLTVGLAAAAVVLGVYLGGLFGVDETAQVIYRPPTVVYVVNGQILEM